MELNITKFYNEANPFNYNASQLEMGEHVGQITWENANDDSADYMILDTPEKVEHIKKYFKSFGAWSDEEISQWDTVTLNALLIQEISAQIRECPLNEDRDDWAGYNAECEAGNCAGNLFKSEDGKIYFSA